MKRRKTTRLVVAGAREKIGFSDPFSFLPIVVEALKNARVGCRLCSVKMINRTGLVGWLCPACFEERCSKCGEKVLLGDGSLASGVKVGRGGSWKCAKCAGSRTKRLATKRTR